jgi:serine/threonine protein kinase
MAIIWRAGQVIKNGRFKVLKELGGGGFGITYQVQETAMPQRLLALKILNVQQQNKADFGEWQEKFMNEAMTLKGFDSHPNIVKVLGVIEFVETNEQFSTQRIWGMLMEWIDGEDLAVYVDRKPLPEAEALYYIKKIGSALAYVHSKGTLHRDVKPSNILLERSIIGDNTRRPVLIDFGLARGFLDGKSLDATNTGTLAYAPIEQYDPSFQGAYRRVQIGRYTDVYALAATLYNLLTDVTPVPACGRIGIDNLAEPQSFNPQISDHVNAAIIWGMQMRGDDRPQTIGEFLGALNSETSHISADESHVRVVGSIGKNPEKPLLLIDKSMAETWEVAAKSILVYRDKTLDSLNIKDLKDGKILDWDDVNCVEPQDLFLSELTFIDAEEALPGAFPVQNSEPLTFNSWKITPLMPLKPLLLEYFTPKDLMKRLHFSQSGDLVRVTLSLPLKGTIEGKRPSEYYLYKDYLLKELNKVEDVPVLEIWPNIRSAGWQEYYAYYYDANNTFTVNFDNAQDPHNYSCRSGEHLITLLSSFPSHINCQRDGHSIGFIPLYTPPEIELTGNWLVGVDFGNLFTNVYVNRQGKIEPLRLEKLHLQVTTANLETRQPVLFENFIPEEFLPTNKPLPFATVLTKRGETNRDRKRVIYDGRIYVPDRTDFYPEASHIETNFRWRKTEARILFLEHLCLMVSALAVHSGIKSIQWSVSYPATFSRRDLRDYGTMWATLVENLQSRTGITQQSSAAHGIRFRTENLALAQYFADREDCNLIRSTCINFGDDMSDISIWQNNTLIHQCSIQLAREHILVQPLEQCRDFVANWFKQPTEEWSDLEEDKFKAKIDSLLRHNSDEWLQNDRPQLEEDQDFQGLIRLIAIGKAGIYYYIGLILNTLVAEKKYTEPNIPSVYIGGRGSGLLHWLSPSGRFDHHTGITELFNRMMVDASGLNESGGSTTQLSKNPQDEVACGLVLDRTKLKDMDSKIKDPPIAGENCRLNGQDIAYNQRMFLEGEDIDEIEVSTSLEQLNAFINSFNKGIKDLEIEEEIQPLSQCLPLNESEQMYMERILDSTHIELSAMLNYINNGENDGFPEQPLFILGLKSLLIVLANEWASK